MLTNSFLCILRIWQKCPSYVQKTTRVLGVVSFGSPQDVNSLVCLYSFLLGFISFILLVDKTYLHQKEKIAMHICR